MDKICRRTCLISTTKVTGCRKGQVCHTCSVARCSRLSQPFCTHKLACAAEVPCAVCKRTRAEEKGTMIPGTTSCPSGFSRDYYGKHRRKESRGSRGWVCFNQSSLLLTFSWPPAGILFAPHTSHQRGEHLCIDYFAEGDGSGNDENGNLLYPVEIYGVYGYKNYATV